MAMLELRCRGVFFVENSLKKKRSDRLLVEESRADGGGCGVEVHMY